MLAVRPQQRQQHGDISIHIRSFGSTKKGSAKTQQPASAKDKKAEKLKWQLVRQFEEEEEGSGM